MRHSSRPVPEGQQNMISSVCYNFLDLDNITPSQIIQIYSVLELLKSHCSLRPVLADALAVP